MPAPHLRASSLQTGPRRLGGLGLAAGLLLLLGCSERSARWEVAGVLVPLQQQQLPPAGVQLQLLPPGMISGTWALGTPCLVDQRMFLLAHGSELPAWHGDVPPGIAGDGVSASQERASRTEEAALAQLRAMRDLLNQLREQPDLLLSADSPRSPLSARGGRDAGSRQSTLRPALRAYAQALRHYGLASQVAEADGSVVPSHDGDATWRRRAEASWAGMDAGARELGASWQRQPEPISLALRRLQEAVAQRQQPIVEACIDLAEAAVLDWEASAEVTEGQLLEARQTRAELRQLRHQWQLDQAQQVRPAMPPTLVYAPVLPGP